MYMYIGISGWGIAWYLNGLLIPKIELYRGFEYTFIVEGGDDPGNPARYHPFYITNNERGGYLVKSEQERKVRVDLSSGHCHFTAKLTELDQSSAFYSKTLYSPAYWINPLHFTLRLE